MRRPVLLALVTGAWGDRGGIAQYNRDFLGALAAAISVRIVPRHVPEEVTGVPPGAKQARARAGRWRYAIAAVRDAIRQRPDVVFCGHLYMAPLAALIARLCRVRLIVQTHGIEAWPRPSRWVRWATEAADLVLAVSRHTRAQVLTWASVEPERVVVLPNTVSERFTPGDRAAARRRFGLRDERVLLTVGRIAGSERYKGHDRVIEALRALVAAGHDVLYLIVGDGDDRPRLEALARAHGVTDRVRFLGSVPDEALPDLYRAADAFVMPSTGEGFGIAYVEAMACGTPAVGFGSKGDADALAPMGVLACIDTRNDWATTAHQGAATLANAIAAWLLDRDSVDADRLAASVRSRFARQSFARRASAAVERLVLVRAPDLATGGDTHDAGARREGLNG